MNIEMKAKVTLNSEDIQQAVLNYINDHGFEIGDKVVEFDELPESIVVEIEGVEMPKVDAKPKARTRSKPQSAVAKVEQPAEDSTQAQIDKAEQEREAVAEQERIKLEELQRKREEASAEAQEVLAAGKAILNGEKAAAANPFASLPTPSDTTEDMPTEDAEPLAGQDILDAQPAAAKPKPRPNPFADILDPKPTPTEAQPKATPLPVRTASIFA